MESQARKNVRCVVSRAFVEVEDESLRKLKRGNDELGLRRFNDGISENIASDVSTELGDLGIRMTDSAV